MPEKEFTTGETSRSLLENPNTCANVPFTTCASGLRDPLGAVDMRLGTGLPRDSTVQPHGQNGPGAISGQLMPVSSLSACQVSNSTFVHEVGLENWRSTFPRFPLPPASLSVRIVRDFAEKVV